MFHIGKLAKQAGKKRKDVHSGSRLVETKESKHSSSSSSSKRAKQLAEERIVWSPHTRRSIEELMAQHGNELEARMQFTDVAFAKRVWDRLRIYMRTVLKRLETIENTLVWVHPTNGYRCVQDVDGKRVESTKDHVSNVRWSFHNETGVQCKLVLSKETTSWKGPSVDTFHHECVQRWRERVSFPLSKASRMDLTKVMDKDGHVRYEIECEMQQTNVWEALDEWFGILLETGLFRTQRAFVEKGNHLYSSSLSFTPKLIISTRARPYVSSSSLKPNGRMVALPSIDPLDYVWITTFRDASHFFVEQVGSRYVYTVPILPAQNTLKSICIHNHLALLCYPIPPNAEQYLIVDIYDYQHQRSVYEEMMSQVEESSNAFQFITRHGPSFTYTKEQHRLVFDQSMKQESFAASVGTCSWTYWSWVDWTWTHAAASSSTVDLSSSSSDTSNPTWIVHWTDWATSKSSNRVMDWPKHSDLLRRDFLTRSDVVRVLNGAGVWNQWIQACLPSMEELLTLWIQTKQAPSDGQILQLASQDEGLILSAVKTILQDASNPSQAVYIQDLKTKLIRMFSQQHQTWTDLTSDLYQVFIQAEPNHVARSLLVRTFCATMGST